jgi:hypothetical protein
MNFNLSFFCLTAIFELIHFKRRFKTDNIELINTKILSVYNHKDIMFF